MIYFVCFSINMQRIVSVLLFMTKKHADPTLISGCM